MRVVLLRSLLLVTGLLAPLPPLLPVLNIAGHPNRYAVRRVR